VLSSNQNNHHCPHHKNHNLLYEQVRHVRADKRTLRYYEEVGLLPLPNGLRAIIAAYSDLDIQLLHVLKSFRSSGFLLVDIRTLLSAEEERGQIKVCFQTRNGGLGPKLLN